MNPQWDADGKPANLAASDAYIEAYAEAFDTLIYDGAGDIIRDAWQDLRAELSI